MVRRNTALIRQLTRDPQGPIGRDLGRRMLRVQNRARVLCPVDFGRLRDSITTTDPRPHPLGLVAACGSNLRYSLAVHEGSGSPYAPPSWRNASVPARRYLTNALPAGVGS
jgi:hypothetical protein